MDEEETYEVNEAEELERDLNEVRRLLTNPEEERIQHTHRFLQKLANTSKQK